MKTHVIVFPGSNCDRDVAVAIENISGSKPDMVWHKNTSIQESDLIVVPGGFSYGDYLRCGAIASTSPVINEVIKKAKAGVPVIGICNGFQILIETSLLDGALIRNKTLSFICKDVYIKPENSSSIFTEYNNVAKMPIAHNEGNYFADDNTLDELSGEGRIVLSYAPEDNPNGACKNIAGICDASGRVLGMMPHPERCAETALGGEDGKRMFTGLVEALS
mgnify:CR=1 FL=1